MTIYTSEINSNCDRSMLAAHPRGALPSRARSGGPGRLLRTRAPDFVPADVNKIPDFAAHILAVHEGRDPFSAYAPEFQGAKRFFETAGSAFCRAAAPLISAHLIPVLDAVLEAPPSKELFCVCLQAACDLCYFGDSPGWAAHFFERGHGFELFMYFTDPSDFLIDALTAFTHQLLVHVPAYRTAFVRMGFFSKLVAIFSDCADRQILSHLSWLFLFFASVDGSAPDLSPGETAAVLSAIVGSISRLYEARLFLNFTEVLMWLLERPEVSQALAESGYFADTVELLRAVVSEQLPLEEALAVLLAVQKIIEYADVTFSVTAIPFSDLVLPLLSHRAPAVAVRGWWVLAASVCREPRWAIPEAAPFLAGALGGAADREFAVKSAAAECAACVLERASACEWGALAVGGGLLAAALAGLDPAETRGARRVDAVCARAAADPACAAAAAAFACELAELRAACADAALACPGVERLLARLEVPVPELAV
jgi:hypothetical protein